MMDGEEVYRARLADCIAAAEASSLPQVRDKHLSAARSWQALLDTVMERKANVAALQHAASTKAPAGDKTVRDNTFEIPDPVVEAVEDGSPAVRAFRQSSGQSQHDVAAGAGMTDERLAEIESGRKTATAEETAELSEALDVPADLLVDE